MLPASTGPAVVVAIADRSACVDVRLVPEALLLAGSGSSVVLVTLTELVIAVPAGVLGDTRNTTVKLAELPEVSVAIVPVIAPVPPWAGLVRVKVGPEVWVTETNVVLAGTSPEAATFWASAGPAFATVTV